MSFCRHLARQNVRKYPFYLNWKQADMFVSNQTARQSCELCCLADHSHCVVCFSQLVSLGLDTRSIMISGSSSVIQTFFDESQSRRLGSLTEQLNTFHVNESNVTNQHAVGCPRFGNEGKCKVVRAINVFIRTSCLKMAYHAVWTKVMPKKFTCTSCKS